MVPVGRIRDTNDERKMKGSEKLLVESWLKDYFAAQSLRLPIVNFLPHNAGSRPSGLDERARRRK